MQAANLQEPPHHRGDVREARVQGHEHLVRVGAAIASNNSAAYLAARARLQKRRDDEARIITLEREVETLKEQVSWLLKLAKSS